MLSKCIVNAHYVPNNLFTEVLLVGIDRQASEHRYRALASERIRGVLGQEAQVNLTPGRIDDMSITAEVPDHLKERGKALIGKATMVIHRHLDDIRRSRGWLVPMPMGKA